MSSADIILATINAKWIHPSLALRLLKANLGSLEDRSTILEFALRQPLSEKVEPILAARPALLALSVSIWNHTATLELLKALEEKWAEKSGETEQSSGQKPLVALGGPEVSHLGEDAEIFRHADYVIRGEGEESFRSLCYRVFYNEEDSNLIIDEKNIQGKTILFINKGETTVDLTKIATAYHLYTDEDLHRKLTYVEASRGCPFGCEFCQASGKSLGFKAVREFPLEPFLNNMEILIDRGARTFKFLDRTFNLDIERTKRIMEFFLEQIRARETSENKPPFCVHFEMVPSHFPYELKDIIKRFPPGSLRLELGIQTFNLQTAALIHRSGDPGEEIETLEFLGQETNAIVHADLIAGLPGEDLASFASGFDRLWTALSGGIAISSQREASYAHLGMSQAHLGISEAHLGMSPEPRFEIQLGILKCLPGTAIARHNKTHCMRYAEAPPYEVLETGAVSALDMGRIKNFARFWEIIVNRNSFPDLAEHLFPPGKPVFERFMILSDTLLERFGRNWGIDKKELETCLEECHDK